MVATSPFGERFGEPAEAPREARPCVLTVLRTTGQSTWATKRWRWNLTLGEWVKASSYSAGAWFTAREMPVASLAELAAAIDEVRRDPRAFVVRGVLTGDAREAIAADRHHRIRRRKHLKNGVVPSLIEAPLRWLMIDIDGWPLPAWADLADDPDTVVDAAIHELLPDAFHDAECFWHLSSSAGFVSGTLKVHLFFWLAEPATNAHAKAVLRQQAPGVDPALYNAAQPHYIADPIIEGAPDPLPRRTGWRKGTDDAVALPALRRQERQSYSGAGYRSAGGGMANILARLGDGDGLEGFHVPLRAATMLYARRCVREGEERDDTAIKALLNAAIQAAPMDPQKRADVDGYLDDAYLDRLIDGAFALLAADPDVATMTPHFTAPTTDLRSAEATIQREVDGFLRHAAGWHAMSAADRGEPDHAAIIATTGLGKSRTAREALVPYITRMQAAGSPHRVLWLVPHHKLSAEAVRDMQAIGISAAVLLGRDQPDPASPNTAMCQNLEAVNDAVIAQLDVLKSVCGTDDGPACPFRTSCGYMRQMPTVAAADVVIAAHNFLVQSLPPGVKEGIGLTITDEGWWQSGLVPNQEIDLSTFAETPLHHPVLRDANAHAGISGRRRRARGIPKRMVADDAATNDLHTLSVKARTALEGITVGAFVDRQAMANAGLTAENCADAIRLEWRRKRDDVLRPGMSPDARKKALEQAAGNAAIPRRVGVWRALQVVLEGEATHTGRLEIGVASEAKVSGRVILLHSRREITNNILERPLLLLDATLPLDIVRHFLPSVAVLADVQAQAPHQMVVQIAGGWGKTTLIEGDRVTPDENSHRRRRVAQLRDLIALHAAGNGAVITYAELEEKFAGVPGVSTGHFNAITGLDHLNDVRILAVIGRPLPRPQDVRSMALALTGQPIALEDPGREIRGVLLEDGTGVGLPCRVYANPDLEAIRAAVTDAEVLQAVGRARGVRRTSDNPVLIVLCADVVLPVPIARVVRWQDVRPNLVEQMAGRGMVLTTSRDLVRCYPDLFDGSVEAAEKALKRDGKFSDLRDIPLRLSLHRGMSRKCPILPCRYRRAGRGQQTRQAWWIPAIVPDPRAWLEERLGPLGFFETIGNNGTGGGMPATQIQPSGVNKMTQDACISDDGLDPAQLFPPMMLFAPPVGLWRTSNGMRIEEVASARIVQTAEAAEAASPAPISLLRYRAKQLERVALEWSTPQGRLVAEVPAAIAASPLPPDLIVLIHSNSSAV